MAGGGQPALATTDPRLVAIAGERAAWNDRTPDSWEHVMPYGVRLHDQRRLLAAGYRVRVAVRTGRGGARRVTADGRRGLAIIGGGKIGEALLSGLIRRGGPDGILVCERSPERAARAGRALRGARRRPRRRGGAGAGAAAGGQAAGHRRAAGPAGRRRGRRPPGGVRGRRRADDADRGGAAARHPRGAGHAQHPGAGGRGDERALRGRERRRAAPRRGGGAAGGGGAGAPGAGEPAGRRHGAVRQRSGVLLLPGRGDGGRRHPAGPAAGRWRPTSSSRPRSGPR